MSTVAVLTVDPVVGHANAGAAGAAGLDSYWKYQSMTRAYIIHRYQDQQHFGSLIQQIRGELSSDE